MAKNNCRLLKRPAAWMAAALILLQSGCAQVDVSKGKPGDVTKGSVPADAPGNSSQAQQFPGSVAGDWKITFQYKNTTLSSTVHLDQQDDKFRGTGVDVPGGTKFAVDQGQVGNGQVRFFKKYQGSPPVEYSGKIEIVDEHGYRGPFMSGEYTTAFNGKIINNIWEAQMIVAAVPSNPSAGALSLPQSNQVGVTTEPSNPPQQGGEPQPANQMQPSGSGQPEPQSTASQEETNQPGEAAAPPQHPPDLSGKWEVGYEYNFKTMHSSMFLEQEGDRVTGHGVDLNTKEKFVIDNGWYHFPKLTLIRKYTTKLKGKKAPISRVMIFKADVSMINDKDYQGPYLNGKTNGGGSWEAQLVKYLPPGWNAASN